MGDPKSDSNSHASKTNTGKAKSDPIAGNGFCTKKPVPDSSTFVFASIPKI